MIYTNLTKQALKLCFAAHKEQVDKCGIPYVFHPFYLAQQMNTEYETVVALLHDVVEDTSYTLEDLRAMGYPAEVVEAVGLLTHDDDTPYLEYVARLKHNPLARAVKLADLKHNSDITRLDSPADLNPERAQRYCAARAMLEEELY
jgi:(p)ppGpp synthase/HD superfamily hydrolase